MNNKPQLFCFTYAGGTKDFFNVIKPDLDGVDVISLEYAGHGKRHREACYQDMDELAEDMLDNIESNRTATPYALFGYSMGSISAVEVLKRIVDSGAQLPCHVFLSAHEPHTKSELLGFEAGELDEWVKNRTIDFGMIPEKLLNNKVFWRTYLPIYRADYTIIGKYQFDRLSLKTTIPVTIFYSETDTPRKEMELWKNYFIDEIDFYCYKGNHFFIQEYHKELADIILKKMDIPVGE